MKTKGVFLFGLLGLLLIASTSYGATDYRSMTTEQLCREYWQQPVMSPQEQQAYRQEWERRVQSASPQERQTMYQKEVTRRQATGPSAVAPAPAPMGSAQTRDYSTMSNEEFYRLCQSPQFMQGLTPEQRAEIDREWQRRIPYMTPEERRTYYPEGLRYGSSMGAGGG